MLTSCVVLFLIDAAGIILVSAIPLLARLLQRAVIFIMQPLNVLVDIVEVGFKWFLAKIGQIL